MLSLAHMGGALGVSALVPVVVLVAEPVVASGMLVILVDLTADGVAALAGLNTGGIVLDEGMLFTGLFDLSTADGAGLEVLGGVGDIVAGGVSLLRDGQIVEGGSSGTLLVSEDALAAGASPISLVTGSGAGGIDLIGLGQLMAQSGNGSISQSDLFLPAASLNTFLHTSQVQYSLLPGVVQVAALASVLTSL